MDEDMIVDMAESCGVLGYLEDLLAFAEKIREYERMVISNKIAKMPGDTAASIAVWVKEQ